MDMVTSRGMRANGPDSGWVDLMVKNLKDELQRQLARVRQAGDPRDGGPKDGDPKDGEESSKPVVTDAKSRAADARTIAVLCNTLERLDRLEQQRAMVRETKVRKNAQDARTALERRLDKLLAGAAAPRGSCKPE